MSRTHRFIQGVGVSYLQQAVTLLGGLWLTRFLLQQVGRDDYGTWLVALQVFAYLELMDFGVVALLPREIAYATGAAAGSLTPAVAAAPVVSKGRRLVLLQTPVVAAAGAAAWWYLHTLRSDNAGALGMILLVYVLQFPLRLYPASLQGLQDLAFLGWARIGLWIVQAAVMVVCVVAGLGMWALAIGWATQQALLPLASWLRLRLAFASATTAPGSVLSRTDAKRFLGRGLWMTVSSIAQVLLNGTEIILVQAALGPAAVVVYVCSSRLINILAVQTYTVVLAAEPALSELRATGQADRLVQVATALRELMLLISGLVACVILSTNEGFVTWWVGAECYGGNLLTCLLLGAMVLRHFTFTLGHLLFCCGYERALALIGLVDGCGTILGGILLIPVVGLVGAPLGSMVGVLVLHLPICLYLLAQDSRTSLLALLRAHVPWMWRFSLLVLTLWLLGLVWKPADLVTLTATGAAVCLVYGLVMLPALQRSPLWPYVQPRIARFCPAFVRQPAVAAGDTLAESPSSFA